MATANEINMFRRLVGDQVNAVMTVEEIQSWLNDASIELTSDFVNTAGASAPVDNFDHLVQQYKPEVVYKAAINWWWARASVLAEQLSTTVGQASQQASEKWDRAMKMIDVLQNYYSEIQYLGTDISIGNLSYFSKASLTRRGGIEEETQRDLF